jgi:hypothetical protein
LDPKFIDYADTGMLVAVRDGVVSEVIQAKLHSGKYERREAKTIPTPTSWRAVP